MYICGALHKTWQTHLEDRFLVAWRRWPKCLKGTWKSLEDNSCVNSLFLLELFHYKNNIMHYKIQNFIQIYHVIWTLKIYCLLWVKFKIILKWKKSEKLISLSISKSLLSKFIYQSHETRKECWANLLESVRKKTYSFYQG